jgi:hypothetical protein
MMETGSKPRQHESGTEVTRWAVSRPGSETSAVTPTARFQRARGELAQVAGDATEQLSRSLNMLTYERTLYRDVGLVPMASV